MPSQPLIIALFALLTTSAACSNTNQHTNPDKTPQKPQESTQTHTTPDPPPQSLTANCHFDPESGDSGALICDDGTQAPFRRLDSNQAFEGDCQLTNDDEDGRVSMTCGETTIRADGSCDVYNGTIFTRSAAIAEVFKRAGCTQITGSLVILSTQKLEDLNAFSALQKIDGSLFISNNTALKNTNGLDALQSIGEDFALIENTSLTNINGLGGLEQIGGNLEIIRNNKLQSIHALRNLVRVPGDLTISENPTLKSIDGMLSVSEVGRSLKLGNIDQDYLKKFPHFLCLTCEALPLRHATPSEQIANSTLAFLRRGYSNHFTNLDNALQNLDGLSNLETLGGDLHITEFHHLETLDGLSALHKIGGHLLIENNASLKEIKALKRIRHVPGSLTLRANPNLESLNGLTNIKNIQGDTRIEINPQITNLNALSNLQYIGHDLSILDNLGLTSLDGLATLEKIGGTISIVGQRLLDNTNAHTILELATNKKHALIWANQTLPIPGVSCQTQTLDSARVITCADGTHLPLPMPGYRSWCNLDESSKTPDTSIPNIQCGKILLKDGKKHKTFAGVFTIWHPIDIFAILRAGIQHFDDKLRVISILPLGELRGLESLKSIGTTLEITDTHLLTSLDGLNGLEQIGNDLNFSNNKTLQNLTGLSSLNSPIRILFLMNHKMIKSLDGLNQIPSLAAVTISGNPHLRSLEALSNIDMTSPLFITITGNHRLESLKGLESLKTIEYNPDNWAEKGVLKISNNDALVDLHGLESLQTAHELEISSNSALQSLKGLENLQVPITKITLKDNPKLTDTTAIDHAPQP